MDLSEYFCQYIINGFILGLPTSKIFDYVDTKYTNYAQGLVEVLG